MRVPAPLQSDCIRKPSGATPSDRQRHTAPKIENRRHILYPCPMNQSLYNPVISKRFRGFLPVVVDVETGGFDPERDALLEIAAVTLRMSNGNRLEPAETLSCHVQPFP